MPSRFKTAVVLGSGYSGSGAVYDYLAGRPDVAAAFGGREFRLLQDPGGLMDLEFALGRGFTPNRADAAITDFLDLARRMARSRDARPPGYGLEDSCPGFSDRIGGFLEAVVDLEYPGLPYHRLTRYAPLAATFVQAKRRLRRRRGDLARDGMMSLPVHQNLFRSEANRLLRDLVTRSCTPEKNAFGFAAVNQAGSFWHPVSSTRLFNHPVVCVVTRNPEDVFADFQNGGYAYPGVDVGTFCRWYRNVMERVDHQQWSEPSVVHVRFEEFVLDHENAKARLDQVIGLDPDVPSQYDPQDSRKNVGVGGTSLPKEARRQIEDLKAELSGIVELEVG